MLAAVMIRGSVSPGASIWMMLATPTRGSSAPTTKSRAKPGRALGPR